MFCKKCGRKIPDDSEFCPICGENQEMTGNAETNKKSTVGGKVGKGVKMAVGVAAPLAWVAGQAVLDESLGEVGKVLKKKAGKATKKLLKKIGVKKKSPVDIAFEVFKQARK